MTTPAYPRPVVRHIGGHAFRDRETVEPVAKEPPQPEWVRRAKAGKLPSKVLS